MYSIIKFSPSRNEVRKDLPNTGPWNTFLLSPVCGWRSKHTDICHKGQELSKVWASESKRDSGGWSRQQGNGAWQSLALTWKASAVSGDGARTPAVWCAPTAWTATPACWLSSQGGLQCDIWTREQNSTSCPTPCFICPSASALQSSIRLSRYPAGMVCITSWLDAK